MGWRYLLYTIGSITIFVFILRYFVFKFRESPKFLIYKGQDEKAIKVVHHMAKTNGRPCHLTMETFESLRGEYNSIQSADSRKPVLGGGIKQVKTRFTDKTGEGVARYGMLFGSAQMTRLTILTWLTYIMDFWGFTVAGMLVLSVITISQLITSSRLLSPQDPRLEERRCSSRLESHICRVHLYLQPWYCWCVIRWSDVSSTGLWSEVDDVCIFRPYGCIHLAPLRRRYCSQE